MIKRKHIDYKKTGFVLKQLRISNINLRRYVCSILSPKRKLCDGNNCENCSIHEMDHEITQEELGKIFNVSDNVVQNWELGRTIPGIEELMLYAEICQLNFFDLLVFKK